MAKQQQPTAQGEPIRKVSIILELDHQHAGKLHQPGETIEVWPDQAERIRAMEAQRKAAAAKQAQ